MVEDLLKKWSPYLPWVITVLLIVLLGTDVFLYSLYQADHARLQTVHRKIERLETYLSNAINSKKNDIKMLSIEQQVKAIDTNLDSLTNALKDYQSTVVDDAPIPPPKKKKAK